MKLTHQSKFFSVALQSTKLLPHLDRQKFQDFGVVDTTNAVSVRQDLSVFQSLPSAYYIVSLCDATMEKEIQHEKFLLRLMAELRYRQTDLLVYTVGIKDHEICVGFVLSAVAIIHSSNIPKSTTGLVVDLVAYVKSLKGRIEYKNLPGPYFEGAALQERGRVCGYRLGPIATVSSARCAINAEPKLPLPLLQCDTNELYGQSRILRNYVGMTDRLPIRGRVVHGWQCGSGLLFDDLTLLDPSYVWNKRKYNCVKDICNVHAIGAPYIYMNEEMDPGPEPNTLLTVPIHSLQQNKVSSTWEEFAKASIEFAELSGFSKITALIYVLDMKPEVLSVFERHGIDCVCAGGQGDDAYLYRLRSIIRRHSTIICSRICTALFYSLYEVRPTYIWGPRMIALEHCQYENVIEDRDWIKHYFPALLAGGLEGVQTAKLELGTDCKRSQDELKNLLYDWLV